MTYPPLSEEDLDELVLNSELLVAIHITANRCPISGLAQREFRRAALRFQDQIAFFEVNADAEKPLISRLNIKAAPALLVFSSGIELAALVGFYSRDELQSRLWSIISNRG